MGCSPLFDAREADGLLTTEGTESAENHLVFCLSSFVFCLFQPSVSSVLSVVNRCVAASLADASGSVLRATSDSVQLALCRRV